MLPLCCLALVGHERFSGRGEVTVGQVFLSCHVGLHLYWADQNVCPTGHMRLPRYA